MKTTSHPLTPGSAQSLEIVGGPGHPSWGRSAPTIAKQQLDLLQQIADALTRIEAHLSKLDENSGRSR
jgi:hypothetical protein